MGSHFTLYTVVVPWSPYGNVDWAVCHCRETLLYKYQVDPLTVSLNLLSEGTCSICRKSATCRHYFDFQELYSDNVIQIWSWLTGDINCWSWRETRQSFCVIIIYNRYFGLHTFVCCTEHTVWQHWRTCTCTYYICISSTCLNFCMKRKIATLLGLMWYMYI